MRRRLIDTLVVLALLAIAAIAALATRDLPHAVSLRDATGGTLSDASRALVERLEAPLEVVVALPPEPALRGHVTRLAARYRAAGAALELRIVDPNSPDTGVRSLGLRNPGQGLVRYRGREERFQAPSEARLSATIDRLLRRGEQFIAWTTDFGERDLRGSANRDLGLFGQALERRGYQLQPLSLIRAPAIPDNAAVVLVGSPSRDLMPGARALLADYLANGGALLWLADGEGDAGVAEHLRVRPTDGRVRDPGAPERLGVNDTSLLLLESHPGHPISADLSAPLLLADARALEPGSDGDWTIRALLRGPTAHRIEGNGDTSRRGPFHLGVTLERPLEAGEQRAAVLGDGDFLANSHLGNGDNLAFGLALVDWLAGGDDGVGRYLEPAPDQRLRVTTAGAGALVGIILVAVPGLFALGAFVAWRRQRRG